MFLTSLFEGNERYWEDRTPIITFPLFNDDGMQIEIFLPSMIFWVQNLIMLYIGILFISMPIAWIMYKYVIVEKSKGGDRENNPSTNKGQRRLNMNSAIVVFGGIVPFLLSVPYFLIKKLELKNINLKFAASMFPVTIILLLVEALHDYSPRGVESSLKQYLIYYSLPGTTPMIVDQKYVPVRNKASIYLALYEVLKWPLIIVFQLSIQESFDYRPFGSSPDTAVAHNLYDDIAQMFNLRKICDDFFYASILQSVLSFFTSVFAFLTQLQLGYKTIVTMNNPLFGATSPSDFWGRRWNLFVHGLLKRSVFKPTYHHSSSKLAAVIASFFVSGIWHEWILHILSFDIAYTPSYGRTTLFFVFNGLLVIIEQLTKGWKIITLMKKFLPKPIITFMVILCVLPVTHWFCDEYRNIGYLESVSTGFPIFKLSRR